MPCIEQDDKSVRLPFQATSFWRSGRRRSREIEAGL
jgi:hypothetical protein